MSGRITSCCLGIIIGFIAALALVVAAAFGVYCHFSPKVRKQSLEMIERQWNELKSSGDRLIKNGAPTETGESTPEPPVAPSKAPVPEPEI